MKLRKLAFAMLAVAGITGMSLGPVISAQAVPYAQVPGQFMAKIYTEGLGRAPDASAWDSMQNYYIDNGCSVSTLSTQGTAVFTSAEFASDYPIPDTTSAQQTLAARVIALYRGALNRDPASSELSATVAALATSQTAANWASIVSSAFGSSEFASLASNQICAGSTWERDPSAYFWNNDVDPATTNPPADARCGLTGQTQASLQAILNATPAGGIVKLAQGSVVVIDGGPSGSGTFTGGLQIPAGVTLTTCAAGDAAGLLTPTPTRYANMARLVRAWSGSGSARTTFKVLKPGSTTDYDYSKTAMVRVDSGAKISRIWVDGNANVPSSYCESCGNLMLMGGAGTSAIENRVGNGAGSAQLQTVGEWNRELNIPFNSEVLACSSTNYVQGNLITAYNSAHHDPAPNSTSPGGSQATWTDGINNGCENTEVSANTIVDATDVSLIVFRSCIQNELNGAGTPVCTAGTVAQQSNVHDNLIVAAGSSAYGALMVSPFDSNGPDPQANFSGFLMQNNTMWTSVAAHFNTGIIAGVRPYTYADTARRGNGANSSGATNAVISGNNTAGQIAYVGNAALVSGLLNFQVTGNTLSQMETAGPGYGGVPSTGYYSTSTLTNWVCPTTSVNSPASMVAETYFGTTTPANYWASGTITTTGTTPLTDQALYYTVGSTRIGCMLGGIANGL